MLPQVQTLPIIVLERHPEATWHIVILIGQRQVCKHVLHSHPGLSVSAGMMRQNMPEGCIDWLGTPQGHYMYVDASHIVSGCIQMHDDACF